MLRSWSAPPARAGLTSERLAKARFGGEVEQAYERRQFRDPAPPVLTAIIISICFQRRLILWVGSHDVLTGTISMAGLGQFVLYTVRCRGARQLSEVWGDSRPPPPAERLFEILRVKSQIAAPASPRALPVPGARDCSLKNVSFAYPTRAGCAGGGRRSLSVRAGEKVATSAPRVPEKSTLFHCCCGSTIPRRRDLVRGIPIRAADPRWCVAHRAGAADRGVRHERARKTSASAGPMPTMPGRAGRRTAHAS